MEIEKSELSPDTLLRQLKANWVNLVLAVLGFAPLLWVFFVMSWGRPAYQFFPMALVATAMLAWRAANDGVMVLEAGSLWITRTLGLMTVILCLAANYLWSPWLGYVAFLLGLAAVLWGLGGKVVLKAFVPAGLMLLTILPPPMNGDQILTLWLRSLAVGTSSSLLDWLQVTHAQDGNTLLLPGKTLLVEEACSGINSFILCNAFCLFWGLWLKRSPGWWLLSMLATSLFVLLGNVFRITIGASVNYFWHKDLLSGRPHEIFGLVLLLGYCGLVLSLDQLQVFLRQPNRSPADGPAKKVSPPAAKPSNRHPSGPVFGFKFAGAFICLVGISVFAAHLTLGGRHGLAALPDLSSLRELKLSLPADIAGWQRVNTDEGDLALVETLGVHTTSWHFQRNGINVFVAADYPLVGFHNVKGCYMGNGWQVLSEKELTAPHSGEDLHIIEINLQKSIRHAMVLHSVVNGQGGWLSAPLSVSSRFQDTIGPPQTGYRIQLFAGGYGPLSAATEADSEELFLQARRMLMQQLVDQLRKAAAK